MKKYDSEWNSHEGECLLVRKVDTFCKNSLPVEHERERKSQKIGAFLLQIVFFLTDFAEFRVKLVFCIQAEIIISSISERYPTVEKTITNHHGNHTFSRKTHNSWDFLPSNVAWNPTFFVRFLKIEIQIKTTKIP